jgi:excinuclease ABC subunit C
MIAIDAGDDLSALDQALNAVPNHPAVFLLWPGEGAPYLGRTALLRRRLRRMLGERAGPSRFLNLRHTVRRVEYELAGSGFETAVRMYELARRHFPETYLDLVRLRMPPYVAIAMQNPFPRSTVTTRLGRPPSVYYGPFRARSTAERFESEFLDLFQVRRCQEDLDPSPDHPGCIYGEMGMCLRPCQKVVGPDEYRHEAERAAGFLATGGRSLLDSIARDRERLSEELHFEEAARQHRRYEKVREVLALSDELARDIDRLHGVALTPSIQPEAVELWVVRAGWWLGRRRLSFEVEEGKPVSLDLKLREAFAAVEPRKTTVRERQEYLALLARWYYSSWREGEWVAIDDPERMPWRKLVHAVSRVSAASRSRPGRQG